MANLKTNFSISALVNPDTSQVQKTLNHTRFKTNVTLDIDTHMVQDKINNLFQSANLDGFDRINTKIQTNLRGFDQYGNAVNGLIKYTETFKNAIGDTQERVTLLSRYGRILGQSTQTISHGIQEMSTDTQQYNTVLNGLNTTVTQVTKTTTDTAGNTRQVVETTREWTDAVGRLNTEITTTNELGEQLAPTIRTVSDNIRQTGDASQQTANQVKTLGNSFANAVSQLTKYYLASLPIRAVQKTITETIDTVKEFDSALVEFRKVSDLAGESLNNYVKNLAQMGEKTGSTMQAMVEAATQFRRSGFDDTDSAKLASVAEMYRNIADEEISAAESASFIIAQMKAFNIETERSQHIIDAVNEVANNFAVSSADISKSLGKMSATMAVSGASFEEQIGMLTGVTEITRNASKASVGLVMITSRLTQVLDDSSSTGKKLTEIYENLGIELKDQDGQLRNVYDILGELAGKWDALSENEQKYIALTQSGARQQQNFVALMKNWGQVVDATNTALGSMGSAAKENSKVMNTVGKRLDALKSQFQQLVIGNGGLQNFAKALISIATKLLEFANTTNGKAVIAVVALGVAVSTLEKGIVKLGTSLTINALQAIRQMTVEEAAATIGTLTFSEAVEAVTVHLAEMALALLTNPIFWIGAVFAGVVIAVEAFTESLDESAKKLQEYKDEIEQTKQSIEGLEQQLENINDRIDILNGKESLSFVEQQELEKLKEQSKELEHQIELRKQELEIARQNAEKEAVKNLQTKGVRTYQNNENFAVTQSEALSMDIESLKELNKQQQELIDKGEEGSKKYKKISEAIQEVTEHGNSLATAIQTDAQALTSADGEIVQLKADTLGLRDEWLLVSDATYKYTKALKDRLKELSEGGSVDLNLRPVINAEELNKAGYETGEGIATVFTQTFSNATGDIAVNFTPIMVDPNTGEYLGVMEKSEFEQYCQDVVDGVREDDLGLQIGVAVESENAIEEATNTAEEIHEIFDELTSDTQSYNEEFQEQADETANAVNDDVDEIDKKLQTLMQTLGMTETELEGLKELFRDSFGDIDGSGLENYLNQLAEIRQSMSDTSTVIDNLQNALAVAQDAWDEYNQQGYLTIDTFQSLMSIQAQYLTALVNENGQLEINQTTIGNLIEKLKQAKIEELQMAEATDIAAYAQGDLDKMSSLARNSLINVGNAAYTAGQNAQAGATGFWTLADAIASARKVAGDTDVASDINIQRIHNSYRKLAKQISEVKVNTTAAGGAAQKAGRAAKSAGSAAKKAGKEAEEAAKKAKKALEDEVKALEKKQKQYERVIKWIEKQYDKEIDKIKKEKDEALDAIEAQIKAREKEKDKILDALEVEIKALKTQKDARKKYWDDQIDALKKANQAKKDSLELQEKLDALEKARNTKVKIYKEGQGFVYDVDQTEVAKAKKALDEYLSEKAYEDELARLEALRDAELDNFEQRINALEDYKDKVEENLEAQIESLEAYKEQVEAQYDAQIKIYEDAKQQFEDMVNAYEEEQDRLLALELAGINAENNNWMLRLENLQNFVSEYHSLLKQVEDAKERLDALNNQETTPTTSTASSGSSGVSSSSGGTKKASSGGSKTYTTHADILPTVTQQSVTATKKLGTSTTTKTIADGAKSSSNPYASLFKHANGIDTIPNDEIAIVGESPNQEMVIGSKLNGKLMSLDKGTGVVNAESSKSLAGMLNQVGKFGASGFGSGGGTLNTNYNNDSLTINGVTIQGANIKDPETFVNGLLSLKSEALQRAYKHK